MNSQPMKVSAFADNRPFSRNDAAVGEGRHFHWLRIHSLPPMLSRDDFQFVLAPWEHRGANFDARPDLVAQLELDGQRRTFLLKVKQNMLWFREAERDDEWVFALTPPLESSNEAAEFWRSQPEFLISWFEVELKSGNFGRAVVSEEFGFYNGAFIFLFAADGRGVAREPWDGAGLSFEWKVPQDLKTEDALDWTVEVFRRAAHKLDSNRQLEDKFGQRELPEKVLEGELLHWICGSWEELERLTQWAAVVCDEVWEMFEQPQRLVLSYRSESEHGRARLEKMLSPSSGYQTVTSEMAAFGRINRLSDILLDYHTPVGYDWEFQGMAGGRNSWDAIGVRLHIEVCAPTAHEKLEARHNLRDWLRGKVSDDEISALLQT